MQKVNFDIKKIKNLFPIFKNKEIVYLDSASTAQMPQMVLDSLINYYSCYKSNVGRAIYSFAEQATEKFEHSRKKIAFFINAQEEEIIFTAGATAGINLVVRSWAQHHIKQGDEIVISEIEHHSNFVPWQKLSQQIGATLKIIPVTDQGLIDTATLDSYLTKRTKLVAMIHTSNMLGTTHDVKAITKIAHTYGAKVLIDATQSVVHHKVDVKNIDCDFLVFSGHKLFGPTGIGVLYIKKNIIQQCDVTEFGGGMVFSVSFDKTSLKNAPHCFESGTQPIAQVIALGSVIDFIQNYIDYELLQKHETELVQYTCQQLSTIADIDIISIVPKDNMSSNLVTFVSDRYHPHDIAAHLDQYNIAIRAGHHCLQPYHTKNNLNASCRVSFSVYNTKEDVDIFIKRLKELF